MSRDAIAYVMDALVEQGPSGRAVSFISSILGFYLMLIHLCIGLVATCHQFCLLRCSFFCPSVTIVRRTVLCIMPHWSQLQ